MFRATAIGLLAALGLLGCKNDGNPLDSLTGVPARGTLLTNPPTLVGSYSTAAILSTVTADPVAQELLSLAYSPKCSIDVYQLQYETVGAKGEAATSSGALMVPTGSDSGCQGPLPILLYAHGTTADKNFNIADLTSSDATEGVLLAAVFAASGYIVVAPNYAGYDTSNLSYHPYLDADQQSKEMIDVLTAARSALPVAGAPGVSDNHKLFVTGYSEGGFVAMATQKAMEADSMTVTAAAPMSGPYALAAFADAIFMGEVTIGSTVNFTLLVSSYQNAYGNIYTATTDVFEQPYANNIATLLPSATAISTIYAQNELPQNELFSSTAPASQYLSITPARSPADLASIFAMGFGTSNLVTNPYRLKYLQDAQSAPDGGFPMVTNGLPASSPGNALRQDLKLNDLRDWTPSAPVLLCGGNEDPTVLFFNTQLMQNYWSTQAPAPKLTVLDVDSAVTTNDPYADEKREFAAAKALVAADAVVSGAQDGGANAVLQAYHATLVPPFCLSAVKSFFDGY